MTIKGKTSYLLIVAGLCLIAIAIGLLSMFYVFWLSAQLDIYQAVKL